jgi:hypothetical protein
MPVAIRGRVSKHQESLLTTAAWRCAAAILRADIDRRLVRQRVAAEDVVEFGMVVAREKHVVKAERESIRLGEHTPCYR